MAHSDPVTPFTDFQKSFSRDVEWPYRARAFGDPLRRRGLLRTFSSPASGPSVTDGGAEPSCQIGPSPLPACNGHTDIGSVPATKISRLGCGQYGVASIPDSGSISRVITSSGRFQSTSGTSPATRFMCAVQIGTHASPPASRTLWPSSNPIHTSDRIRGE